MSLDVQHALKYLPKISLPCVSVEILELQLGDGYTKGNEFCGGGLWDLELQL